MTTSEAAAALGVSAMTISRMARDGRLTPVVPGAALYLFDRAEVEALAAERAAS